jgi:hypothetical protein
MKFRLVLMCALATALPCCRDQRKSPTSPKEGYGWELEESLIGKSSSDVIKLLGVPEAKHSQKTASQQAYKDSPKPGNFDEQWTYVPETRMAHTFIYFKDGKVSFAIEEHSDF